MKRKIKLDFSSERQTKAKRMRSFIISFTAFVIVLGAISILMFYKSVNFDMSNIFNKNKSTTNDFSTTEETTILAELTGKSNLLFVCFDINNNISSAFIIKNNMEIKTISVYNLAPDAKYVFNDTSLTLNEHFVKNGISGMKLAVENQTKIKIDKYIKATETNFKKIIDKIGTVDVNIPFDINYKSNDFTLSLNSGVQNLSGDMLVKYLKISKDENSSKAFAAFLDKSFSKKTIEEQDALFYNLINLVDTDISVVDYSDKRNVISAFSNLSAESKYIKSIINVEN
ncbi:MAG: LCP family protein [Oscillospiraceae bacterium]